MEIIGLIIVLGLFALAVNLTAKFLLRVISKKEKKPINPYINYHKSKMRNDKDYQDYIEWLKKEGSGIPIKKAVSPEDVKAEREINNLFR